MIPIKKILLFLFIITFELFSQDFSGIRIYINPGHGGHDSNDRYNAATGFWESEGNLSKGIYLKEILDSLNAETKLSRTTNNSSDDLALSVIVADANNFDADYFHSIHSNAYNGQSNYTLVLFQGGDNSPTYPQAKIMGSYLADEIYKAHRTTTKYNRGDADFYGTGQPYLGVLKGLTMPGTLSEGSFHDYIPESFRLKNEAYLKHEAWAITKSFIKYFSLEILPFGEIAGFARDNFEPVDYFYINGTKDKNKPANLVNAVLLPDSIVYNGDSYNNGFFFFDRLNTGEYDIILNAENYLVDTIHVNVQENQTTFVDQYLVSAPNYSPPFVTTFLPSDSENVRLDSKIILNFNVKMDKINTQAAFKIIPTVQGTFTWENNDKRLIFSPNNFLSGGTQYEVSLNIFAKSYYDILIEQPFIFSFDTRSALRLFESYPENNSSDISKSVKIKLQFDGPIDQNTLGGNVYFHNNENNDVDILINETNYENGEIIFEPMYELQPNSDYKIKLLNGIKDTEGSNLISDTTINFKTESLTETEGNILFDFEEMGNWIQPSQNISSFGINIANTNFSISKSKFISGLNCGKLKYNFSVDSSGICKLENSNLFPINLNLQNNFGLWIFGDLSYNYLEICFYDSDSNEYNYNIGNINWTGWKFREINLENSDLFFNSLKIIQNENGEKFGELFFDDIQFNIITEIENNIISKPNLFYLKQNYPNPFNPTTTIEYSIPKNEKGKTPNVKILLFDILGREIKTLVNESHKPGNYKIQFDGSNLPSGVFYYQLKYESYLSTKKMMLIK
ncbi:MAG: Ig-like domain-containing protein [Ignavibacteriae bacterium]|nr:Ig-like domain-containing protein [Ignavibacteriota bacterium]